MQAATSVVIVTCFGIPKGHIFDHPKVVLVPMPPHRRVKDICRNDFNGAILPEMLDDLKKQLEPQLAPGVLLLVSAGFGGKSLLAYGKEKGAVAIDFGAGMDALLGHQTRALELHARLA
jgi:hypothetical protein